MTSTREKALVHIYADLAGLTRQEYRAILHNTAGVATSKNLDQDGFERVMSVLEASLWNRVAEGVVADPRTDPRHARMNPTYWRSRTPGKGTCNSRLRWKLDRIWDLLAPMLPEEERNEGYLAAIIANAGGIEREGWFDGYRIQWERVPYRAAYLAVNALNDRLRYAARSAA